MLNRYINIGIWVCAFFGVGVLTYHVVRKDEGYRSYCILFLEPLGGLYVGSEVFLNGIPVGTVQSLDAWGEGLGESLVVVKSKEIKQKEYVRAEVGMRGFTGHSCINMSYTRDKEILGPIQGLEQIKSAASLISRIRSKLDALTSEGGVDVIIQSLSQSIDGIKYTFEELRNVLAKLHGFIDNADSLAQNLPDTLTRVNTALDSISTFVKRLDGMVNESHLPVLFNEDLKSITYSQSDIRKIFRDLRIIIESIKHSPTKFLSSGIKDT